MLFNTRQWDHIQKGYHFTDRQIQIVKSVCDGLENMQIAKKFGIKYNTARTHVRNICRKVTVRGRAELILRLIQVSKHA